MTAAGDQARLGASELHHSYAHLPDDLHARVLPTPVGAPRLLRLNRALAEHLGLDPDLLSSREGVETLAGNRVPSGAQPIAMAYAGHQFGRFVPTLGDGRAVLLGEVVARDGARHDLHLKGAGPTPFSRNGDGRAGLGPVLREYVLSEAMAGLGIPTTRSLAMVTTGEPVVRPQGTEPGAVLTRTARSHVRVGTFEYLAHRGKCERVRTLADYVIERWAPQVVGATNPYRAFLDEVVRAQAELVARWMLVGFIHGVMNTDNVSVVGETIDYGPCAFMDAYHPATVYSSIDRGGRYAYDQQPRIGHWNLACFAETLLPLLGETEESAIESAREALDAYGARYHERYTRGLVRKIGLVEAGEADLGIAQDLLRRMTDQQADFTATFRALSDTPSDDPGADAPVRALFREPESWDAWAVTWRARLAAEARDDVARRREMREVNPGFIPRNHRVQQAIDAAIREGDLRPLDDLLAVVSTPYADHPDRSEYARPPQPHEVVRETFCGT